MAELNEIYNSKIVELAASLSKPARLNDADATATAHSKLCGSTIGIDLKMRGGKVTAYAQTVKACLLGQAAASVMAREIVGSTEAELRAVAAQMHAMLKQDGDAPKGRWEDLAVLAPVRAVRARHASALLVFEAVERALDELAEPQRQSVGQGP